MLWKKACIVAWTFFIFFEIYIQVDHLYSRSPLCPYSDNDYPLWYWMVCYTVLGGYIMTWIILFTRIFYSNKATLANEQYYTAFHMVSMGFLATAIGLFFDWGGICVDVLGFEL